MASGELCFKSSVSELLVATAKHYSTKLLWLCFPYPQSVKGRICANHCLYEYVSTNLRKPCCLMPTAPNSASAHLERDFCFKRPLLVSLRLITLRLITLRPRVDSKFGHFQKGNHATNEWRRRRRKLLGFAHTMCPCTCYFIAPFSRNGRRY